MPVVDRGALATANDRLKQGFGKWLWSGIALATVVHFLAFTFWPRMRTADFAYGAESLEAVDLPPEVDIPPPPERIARPATPIISASADISQEVTIAPTTFAENPIDELPPPPPADEDAAFAEYQAFVPSMVRPKVRNLEAVARQMQRLYPSILRDAGIGGTTLLQIWLDDQGEVQRATVARTSGHTQLDEAALKVIDYVEFSPAMNRDRKVKVRLLWPIQWTPV